MHHRTLLGSLLLALTHPATAAPALVDFGPAGFTREVRQVRMRFSEDMVALGDSAAPGAASVSCNQSRLKAAGHWIDPRNWVAEFDAPLPDGVACEVAPAALTSVKGVSLPAMAAWSFNTGGPRAELIDLRIDVTREEPVGVFKPSVAVDADSLRHLRCQVDAVDTPVTILDGASRKVALAKKRPAQVGSPDTDRWIVAQCGARPWPNGARINWIWGKAISANGVASVLDASYHQRVRPALRYDVKCSQLPERGGCDPRGPFTVVFSEPLYNAGARSMKLRGGEGREYAVESNCGYTTSCTEFSVKTVLREGESITPVFSHAIHDIEGRLMADDSSTRRAFPIARLKPYVGIVQGNVALPWTPGTQARIAVAARNTEPEISVRSLRFGAAPRDISALIALHRMAAAGFEDVLTGALPLKPYAASDAVITRLGQTRSAMTEQKLRPSGPGMEFIGLPLAGFGTWLVEADSALHRAVLANLPVAASARNRPGDRGTDRLALVQLTNLRITSRLSPDHPSLVWVSAIDSGKPVGGAEVELWSCDGKRLAQAVGDAEGRVLFAHLPAMPACEAAGGAPIGEFYIVARSGDDICVLHNSAFDKHSAYRSAMAGHTILDRVLFKAGETVSMQSLARMPVPAGFAIPRPFKGKLKIYVGGDELVHEQELAFDRDGSATSEWKIPKTARLGYYSFTLFDADDKTISQGGFQVEEYRLPSFDASLTAATAWQGDRQYLTLSGGLRFLAGGAAAGQRVTLRGRYDGYSFYGDSGHTFQDIERGELNAPPFAAHTLTLDAAGKAAITLPAPLAGQYMALNAEMEFVDPNGETQTERVHLPIWPQRHRVGVSVRNGIGPGLVRFSVLVLDEKGKPLPNQEVKVDGAEVRRDVKYQLVLPIDETKRFSLCTVKTGADGKGECTVKWSRTGTEQQEWLLRATAPDASAASVTEGRYFFSAGTGGLSVSDADADKVLAGQPLTLTLRSPLVPATALFTIEREGVLASHVRTVSSSEQAIVLPTEPHYAPGVQINVQIVAGAAQASVSPEESPSHSAAYHTSALFDSASHRLKVDLATPHGQVRPGQTVPVSIKVSHGARPAVGARVTLLAFDDALTALQMNLTNLVLEKFWKNRYPTMYSRELLLTWPNTLALGKMPAGWPSSELRVRRIGLYVAPPAPLPAEPETDTILVTGTRRSVGAPMSRVQNAEVRQEVDGMIAGDVGAFPDRNLGEAIRRSIGFAGGPRQADSARTDFSSLALWKTDIVLDRNGEAVVAVPLRDSLTRWRIVAVAMDGTDRYGTGKTFLQTRKNIQILSGLPPSVRSDDTLRQKLTVRNDGERAVTLQLQADARLVADPSLPQGAALSAQARAVRGLALRRSVTLAPHQDKVIDWKLTVPGGLNALDWSIGAVNPKVANGDDNDSLKVMQKVVPAAPVTVRESTVVQLDAPRSIGVAQPPGARPLGGGVAVSWRASLAESAIGSAQAWMAAYPFRCMEQVSSMAVVGAGPAQWQQAMAQLPKFMDANGLVSYFPGTRGSEVLTAYLLDISAAAQLPLPAPEKVKMRAALRKALVGKETVDWLPANGALAHRLALQAALEGDLGDAAQVVPPDLNALPTIALLDWVRHLMTGADTPARRARLDAAAGMLRNRFDLQGTRLTWRGDSGNTAWWMMWTDNVATARTAFLLQQWAALDPRWKDDLPRLMLALVDQQRLGHWDTTVANAWAVASLRRFARDGERGPVGGVSTATYGGATSAQHWPKDEPAILPWPQQGARGTLELRHEGAGAPWATVRVMATMQGDKAVSHGISVKRSVSAVQRKVAGQWSEGDVMKVTLEFTSGAEASWLAVTDPIPSGATILGKGLGGESMLAQRSAAETGSTNWWNRPSYEERGNDSYRAFYQRVTAQTWTTSYTLRLNNAGSFVFPPTRVEAMYAPEIFAETPIAPLQVKP